MRFEDIKIGQRVNATCECHGTRIGVVDHIYSGIEAILVRFEGGGEGTFQSYQLAPIDAADDAKSDSAVAPLGSPHPTLDDLWLGRRVRIEKEDYKHHGKEGIVVQAPDASLRGSSYAIVRLDDGAHVAQYPTGLVVIAAPIEKQLREKTKTFTYTPPISQTEWPRVYNDSDKPLPAGSLFNEADWYSLVGFNAFSVADFTEQLRRARAVRKAIPFIWLSTDDGVETVHIVDGTSEVYFMATVAKIADGAFKWTLHENKRLMRIGFSSDLKTAKEDAEKFCRKRMAVHREPKETK